MKVGELKKKLDSFGNDEEVVVTLPATEEVIYAKVEGVERILVRKEAAWNDDIEDVKAVHIS